MKTGAAVVAGTAWRLIGLAVVQRRHVENWCEAITRLKF